MSQEDINDDLGHYIKEKNKKEPFWKKFKPQHKPKADEEEIKVIIEDAKENEHITPQDKKELEKMEHKIEEVNDVEERVEEEIDDEREGILQRFFKKLNFGKKKGEKDDHDMGYLNEKNDSEEDDATTEDEEMKEFLKSMHSWITKLDPETQKEFKNSKDFEKYTEMLRKHGLIK
jgi:hypothetical protein